MWFILFIFLLSGAVSALVTLLLFSDKSASKVEIHLDESPQRLDTLDIAFKYLLAILKVIPGYPAPLRANAARTGFSLPQISVQGTLQISDEDVKLFAKAVRGDGNLFLLVVLTLPLLVEITTRRECPIKPLGSVNTRNVFRWKTPAIARDAKRLREAARLGKLSYRAEFGGEQNPGLRKKRGVEACVKILVSCEGEEVLEQEVWFMQFLHSSTEPRWQADTAEPAVTASATVGDSVRELHMDGQDPRNWAGCCKDYNPIHISAFGAKLFGFASIIAHGNQIVALAVEQLRAPHTGVEDVDALARQICWESNTLFTLEVAFKRPLTLPASAEVCWRRPETSGNRVMFDVSKGSKVCVEGVCYSGAKI